MQKHHHRFLVFSLISAIVGGCLAAGGYWAYFNFYARFRPVTITRNQAAIESLLAQSDYVSPGAQGPVLWMVSFRDCQPCTNYQRDEFPKLTAKDIDTRVIVFARADRQGQPQSTQAERATVAELWINRDWGLYGRWMATPRREWAAPGLKFADTDWARRAVVNATRDYINQLAPLLTDAGLTTDYPLLIWRDRQGLLKACACTDSRSYHFVRADLGVDKPLIDLQGLDIPFITNHAEKAQSDVAPVAGAAAPLPAQVPAQAAAAAPIAAPPAEAADPGAGSVPPAQALSGPATDPASPSTAQDAPGPAAPPVPQAAPARRHHAPLRRGDHASLSNRTVFY